MPRNNVAVEGLCPIENICYGQTKTKNIALLSKQL